MILLLSMAGNMKPPRQRPSRGDSFDRRGLVRGALQTLQYRAEPTGRNAARSADARSRAARRETEDRGKAEGKVTTCRSQGTKIPSGLPPYLRDLYRTSLLDAEEEIRVFRRLAALKSARERVATRLAAPNGSHSAPARPAELEEEIVAVRNRIVEANLRLVVSIAKQFAGPGQPDFFDLISEGNDILLKAVDRFDVEYGTRFSTYATTAVRRHFIKIRQMQQRQKERFVTGSAAALEAAGEDSGNTTDGTRSAAQLQQVTALLDELDERERLIVEGRFGLGDCRRRRTFRELGQRLGVSKERVRQLHLRALDKLRAQARRRRIEPPA